MLPTTSSRLFLPDWILRKKKPLLMGIVNVTPDSFYEGARTWDHEAAFRRGVCLVEEGADALDVGGESTRPGADPVPEEEELKRILPVVEALAKRVSVPISIDTTKSEVARRALAAGASWINDISGLRADAGMVTLAASENVPVILMHRQGDSKTMQKNPSYQDVVHEIKCFFEERIGFFKSQGGDVRQILLDPGIGFGKNLEHNLALLKALGEFKSMDCPLVLGASRKSFIGRLLLGNPPPSDRLEGSLAVACWAAWRGVDVLRVHDVGATRKALQVWQAIASASAEVSPKSEVRGSKSFSEEVDLGHRT